MEYKFTPKNYCDLAERILAKLTSPYYFSGRVNILGENDCEISLTATLILYREPHSPLSESVDRAITGVGVVWYDIDVFDGEAKMEEDFDMELLKRFLLNE